MVLIYDLYDSLTWGNWLFPNLLPDYTCRGATTLDGARGKKQIWCPYARTWGLSEANILKKYVFDIVETFRRPSQSFGARGIVLHLNPLVTPLHERNFVVKWGGQLGVKPI